MYQETPKPEEPLISRQQVSLSVIPPRCQGNHRQKSSSLLHKKEWEERTFLKTAKKVKDQFICVKSNVFLRNLSGQPRPQNLHLVKVYTQRIYDWSSAAGEPLFYDPELSPDFETRAVDDFVIWVP